MKLIINTNPTRREISARVDDAREALYCATTMIERLKAEQRYDYWKEKLNDINYI